MISVQSQNASDKFPPSLLTPGQLFGRYRVERMLGKGGMGVVYRARDLTLDRPVAIKLLSKLMSEDLALAELLNEARTVSSLTHPNICTVYEAGEEEGQAYICMEYVGGVTLSSVVRPSGLPSTLIARYGSQVAQALEYAHQRGVVHRDVKSNNIALNPDGLIKLLDFGLAQHFRPDELSRVVTSHSSLDDIGAIAGTLPYLAPEILRGRPSTPRSDLWSLGVVLHEMSTGNMPFRGNTAFELTMGIMDGSRVAIPASVPESIRSVIEHCLEKDPARRYESADKIVADLLRTDRTSGRNGPFHVSPIHKRRAAVALLLVGLAASAFRGAQSYLVRQAPAAAGKTETASVSSPAPTIAVLPFQVIGDPEGLGPGAKTLTEALTLNLSQLRALNLVPGDIVATLGGTTPIEDAARQFGVELAITGTVEGSGNQVTILVRLEQLASHKVIWAEQFSGSRQDLLGMEDRIFQSAIAALRLNGDLRRRTSIAVLALRNSTGRASAAWLSTAVSEMLTSELAAGEQLRAIPGDNIARLKLDLPMGDSDSLSPETMSRIRASIGSDYIILGSFTDLGAGNGGGNMRLDLRLQDTQNGVMVAAFAETGTEAGLFDLVSRAGARLREALKVAAVEGTQVAGVRSELPSDPEVAKLYADGLAKLRALDAIGARPLLEMAVARDPQFPLGHSALGSALSALGYDAKARDEAKKAFDLSPSLHREEQLLIEGRYRSVTNQWRRAQEVYRTLFQLFPDDMDYGLSVMTTETMNGESEDVIATLKILRQMPRPASLDPRIDLAEAYWAESVSDFKREQQAAAGAIERGEALGSVLVVARASLAKATALWKLGRPDLALAEFRAAGNSFASRGDLDGEAQAVLDIAQVNQDRGNLDEARDGYEQALKAWRAAGDYRGVAVSLNNLGLLRWQQGDGEGANKFYDQSLEAYREIDDSAGAAGTLNNAANVFYSEGRIATARRMYEQAAAKYGDVGDKYGLARELTNIALVMANQGDLASSRIKYEQAVAIDRELGTKSQWAEAVEGLGDLALEQGDLNEAGKLYSQALATRREMGEKGSTAETQLDLAWLALEQGHPADARKLLTSSGDELRREGELDLEAYGEAALAEALLGENQQQAADVAATRARTLADKAQNRGVWLAVAIVQARVGAASGDPKAAARARQTLTSVEDEAKRLGFVDRQLEARLALIEIDLKGDDAKSARARLPELERQAEQLGFGLIAQKTRKLI